MNPSRRKAMAGIAAAALSPLFLGPKYEAEAAKAMSKSPINVMVSRDWDPLAGTGPEQRFIAQMTKAVLSYVKDAHGPGKLPIWGRPASEIDLRKRVANIGYWAVKAVRAHRDVYPVDPVWVLAQIMSESFYYEYAISGAFAVGVCQFIPRTARSFGMVCAGDKPEHAGEDYKDPQLVGRYLDYSKLRAELKALRRANRDFDRDHRARARSLLEALVNNKELADAEEHLAYLVEAARLQEEMNRARRDFRAYLKANFKDKSIFDTADLRYLRGFDERVTYQKPVDAMVLMLARGLRARKGNILAAAAGFHAGLGNTLDQGAYGDYGRIPSFEATVNYVSRVLVNHHEIRQRMK